MKSIEFSISRLLNLTKRDLFLQKSSIIMYISVVSVLLLIVQIFSTSFNKIISYSIIVSLFTSIFLFTGALITARIFNELHSKSRSYSYLTLPASNIEKFFTKWFLSFVIFTVLSFILIYVVSIVSGFLSSLIYNVDFHFMNILENFKYNILLDYFKYHTLFLAGAIFFKSKQFLKTILLLLIGSLLIGVFFSFTIFSTIALSSNVLSLNEDVQVNVLGLLSNFNLIYFFIVTPLLLLFSYYKFRTVQV